MFIIYDTKYPNLIASANLNLEVSCYLMHRCSLIYGGTMDFFMVTHVYMATMFTMEHRWQF